MSEISQTLQTSGEEEVLNLEPLNLEPESEASDEADDDFDTPYRPAETIRLPFRESDFPVIMRQLLAASPANRKVPIFISTLSPLGALATRLRIKYPYDIMLHAILLQTIIEAPPSTGKRCFAEVVRQIIEPTLEARDIQQRRMEQEYREKKNARTQNEKIGEAPKTTVRCIPPATSKTVIVKRADYYDRILGDTLTFWMWAEELAQLGDAGKSGFSNLRTVMRIAYDLGSKFGQDFASDNSYSGTADVCICSMFCATPQDVDEIYNRKEVMGGGTSRVILVTLEDEAGAKPAIFRELTDDECQLVRSALDVLMRDTYTDEGLLQPIQVLDTSWLDAAVDRFSSQTAKRVLEMKTAGQDGYRSLDHYRKRGSVNAYRAAALLCYLYQVENRMAEIACAPTPIAGEPSMNRVTRSRRKVPRSTSASPSSSSSPLSSPVPSSMPSSSRTASTPKPASSSANGNPTAGSSSSARTCIRNSVNGLQNPYILCSANSILRSFRTCLSSRSLGRWGSM